MIEPRLPRGAEAFSFWTHILGAALAVAGLVALVVSAKGPLAVAAVAVYGATLVVLFLSSALHHTFPNAGPATKDVLRRADHIAIYLFIAGTYTPVCLLAVPPLAGLPVLALVWGFAAVGIALKVLRPFARRAVTAGIYVVMGWLALAVAKPVYDAFPAEALALLLGGGLVYTGGAVIYARKRPDPFPALVGFHGLWHLLVLAAAALHFAFVLVYVV